MIGKMVLIYAKLHRDVYFSGASQAKRVKWVASNSNPWIWFPRVIRRQLLCSDVLFSWMHDSVFQAIVGVDVS